MEQEKFKYEIGGKAYVQRPLSYGQFNQLVKSIRGVVLPSSWDPVAIIAALGDRLPHAIAVLLLEEAVVEKASRDEMKLYLKYRDLDALAEELEFDLDIEMPLTVIADFFDTNPTVSVLEKLVGLIKIIKALADKKTPSSK